MPEAPQAALFAYGTLMFGPVLDRVLGRRPDMVRAAAPAFAARTMAGQRYPGMIPMTTSVVGGVLLLGLSEAELALLDDYEGPPYRRVMIEVVDDRGSVREATTYLVDARDVTEEPWVSREFYDTHLEAFLAELDGGALSEA